jgi:hypothetical protein
MFYGHLVSFMDIPMVYIVVIWHVLWTFGIFYVYTYGIYCGHLVIFSVFGTL